MKKYTSYNISGSEGKFYTTSKEPKDGYVSHTYKDLTTGDQKQNYRKTVNELSGKLKYFGLKEVTMKGKEVAMMFITLETAPDTFDTIDIQVFGNKSNSVNDYVKSFCQYFDNLIKGKETTISLNREKKNDKGYLYKSVYIKQDNENLQWAFKSFGEDSIVPKPVKEIHKVTKKETWDFSPVDSFYYDILLKYKKENNSSYNSNSETQSNNADTNSVNLETVGNTTTSVEEDDLPF